MYLGLFGTAQSEPSTSTLLLTPDRSAQVGQTIVIAAGSGATSGNDANFGATDTKGNTWVHVDHGYRSGAHQISALTCKVTTELGPGDTITIDHAGTGAALWQVAAYLFDDLGTVDVHTNMNAAGGTGLAVGPTAGSGAQASQLVFAAFIFAGSGTTFTPTAGWASDLQAVGVTGFRSVASTWKYVNAAGARSAAGTIAPSSTSAGVVIAVNAPVQPQVAKPTSTIIGGTVTPGGTASHIAVSDDLATSYTDSGASPTNDPKEWGLGPLSRPSDLSTLKVMVEESRVSSASGSFKIIVKEGATVRSTSSAITITSANPRWYTYSVPSGDATAIVDWTNLRVRVEETAA